MSQNSPETETENEYVPTPSLETRVRAITRIPLIKIAAECHRRKWQFDQDEETRMPAAEARRLVRLAFDTLHRIGDMAHKAAEVLRSAPKDQADGLAQCQQQWRPIETAAPDKVVLGYQATPGDFEDSMAVCWAMKTPGGPVWLGAGGLTPTHWMPLPAGPSDSSTARAMQQLADQAQELDMGYSSSSTGRESTPFRDAVIEECARFADRITAQYGRTEEWHSETRGVPSEIRALSSSVSSPDRTSQ